MRQLSAEAARLADEVEQIKAEKSAEEIAHEEAMHEWRERGGMRFGPPPIPETQP